MLLQQIIWLLLLSLPVACVAWTITHAELFREAREYFTKRNKDGKTILERKFFFLLICDYCFSHYVALFFIFIARYQLLFNDWRGYLIAWFSVVWISNFYMSAFTLVHMRMKLNRHKLKRTYHDSGEGERS